MSIVYLNGTYMPIEEAKISPLDRGFLFGDGIYEVIPSYAGKMVGFGPHIDRMIEGLAALEIELNWSHDQWREVCQELIERNPSTQVGLYLHVTRGADTKRHHPYPKGVEPTVFAMPTDIPPAPIPERDKVTAYKVTSMQDQRWQRCNIKSISLLGNVMHYQQGYSQGSGEVLLFNGNNELTECGACNAYIVKNGTVITPALDHQILPGITRLIALGVLREDGSITVEERIVTKQEVFDADEIWISSSSKEIAPVTQLDGKAIGNGMPGPVWEKAAKLYSAGKFNY
jgi:D-alanine transaminase|tara:strand:+ start:1811 stop:2668 length:858 start_codon:yes stop_codon:yes gene_type:complete